MIASALVTAVFFSPLLFIIAVGVGLALLLRGRKKTGAGVSIAAAALLYLLSVEPIHDALLLPLENRYPPVSQGHPPAFDAVAILGGGVVDHTPDFGGRATLTAESLKRLAYGFSLARINHVPIFVTGGIVWGHGTEPEATAAEETLTSLGVPESEIRREGASRTTWENATMLAPLLKPFKNTLLVTSAYHMPRSVIAFSHAGIAFLPAPTDYKVRRAGYDLRSFLPDTVTLAESFHALREYIGILQYLMRG